MTLVPRLIQVWLSGSILAIAILFGTVQAAIDGHIAGPFAAVILGVLVSPAMLRGARTGFMSPYVAWSIAAVGGAVPVLATLQLDPRDATYLSVSWYTCGVLSGAMLVWMAHRPAASVTGVAALTLQTLIWAGPIGLVRLGLVAEVLLLGAMLLIYRTIRLVGEAAEEATARERQLSLWQAQQDAFHAERRRRLQTARTVALPLLQQIIDTDCVLDERMTVECRILEQTVRDEIRGRSLLSNDIRAIVAAHRQRGATVQVLDDGGLDDLEPALIRAMLDELAQQLRPLRSMKIIIRTANPDFDTAITLVATTPDPSGTEFEDDEVVDLFTTIPRLQPTRTYEAV